MCISMNTVDYNGINNISFIIIIYVHEIVNELGSFGSLYVTPLSLSLKRKVAGFIKMNYTTRSQNPKI
jgi:hypothetical protein